MPIRSIVILAFDSMSESHVRSVEAVLEINEFNQPFAIEVLGLKGSVGEVVAKHLLAALSDRQIRFGYDSEVDALTFSFGDGTRSVGQRLGTLELGLSGEHVAAVRLTE